MSVIVPVYNGERYLASALQSVFEQDYHPFEVIVVDDGSVDRSADIACSYRAIRYIYQSNQGVAVARNVGIAAARGEFIAFLDQDDLWAPNKLSVQIDYLLKHHDVGYVLARQRLFVEPGTNLPPWLKKGLLLKDHTGFLPGTLVVRKTVIEQIGEFDSNYSIADDADWLVRAKDAGVRMVILPETLHHKRIHGSNLSSRTQVSYPELLKVLKISIDRQRRQKSGDKQEGFKG